MSRSPVLRLAAIALAVPMLALACSKQDAPKTDLAAKSAADSASRALSPDAKRALDSGNVLFRKKAYDAALTLYQQAAAASPAHPAPLFGMYMVGRATNNRALSDSAMAGIRARNAVPPHDIPDSAELQRIHANVKKGLPAAT